AEKIPVAVRGAGRAARDSRLVLAIPPRRDRAPALGVDDLDRQASVRRLSRATSSDVVAAVSAGGALGSFAARADLPGAAVRSGGVGVVLHRAASVGEALRSRG